MSTYYRNAKGDIVHMAGCERMSGSARPWLWPEGRSQARIEVAMAEQGIRPCGHCKPPLKPRAVLRVIAGTA